METVVLGTVVAIPVNPSLVKRKRPDKRQVQDGDIVIGTVERDRESGGVYAILESTGEQKWFKRGDAAEYWLRNEHASLRMEDEYERSFARHQWDYISDREILF